MNEEPPTAPFHMDHQQRRPGYAGRVLSLRDISSRIGVCFCGFTNSRTSSGRSDHPNRPLELFETRVRDRGDRSGLIQITLCGARQWACPGLVHCRVASFRRNGHSNDRETDGVPIQQLIGKTITDCKLILDDLLYLKDANDGTTANNAQSTSQTSHEVRSFY